jgi:type VI secretion system protein ImpA
MSIFEYETIYAPISDAAPCGMDKDSDEVGTLVNLFSDLKTRIDIARKIEEARNELELIVPSQRAARLADYGGRENDPSKDPQWRDLAAQSFLILEQHSKDMRVVTWFFESMVRTEGFEGFSEAIEVVTQLIKTYGPQLYPHDAGNPSYSLRFLDGLTQAAMFTDALRRVRLTDTDVSFASKTLASHLASVPDQRDEFMTQGALTYDAITAQVTNCDATVFADFMSNLQRCIEQSIALDELLQDQPVVQGASPYRFSKIRDELTSIQAWFKSFRTADESNEESIAEDTPASATTTASASGNSGPVKSRDEALQRLLSVADFFRKTEPHSPLSYALEQAVRWGKMPLPNLLKDLIENEQVLGEVYRRMGIQPPSDGENSDPQ